MLFAGEAGFSGKTQSMANVDHLLHKHTRAADVLKEQIREIAGDDTDLIRDMIEGETPLRDLIAMGAEQNVIDSALVAGISEAMTTLRQRKERIEQRIELRRVALLVAMQSAEIKTIETPAGTLTRKAVPPSALILDEAAIPSGFWKASDPRLDKRAVLDALKAGNEVPGAQLSNGGETLQIRS